MKRSNSSFLGYASQSQYQNIISVMLAVWYYFLKVSGVSVNSNITQDDKCVFCTYLHFGTIALPLHHPAGIVTSGKPSLPPVSVSEKRSIKNENVRLE